MPAEVFATLFNGRTVRLVVLNCCLGASPSAAGTLSGLGPYLMRSGVPAVVAMRYEVPDVVSVKFANEFYRNLLTGREPGRVDRAVERARLSVHLSQTETTVRGFVTPVLYLAPGRERLFAPAVRPAETRRAPAPVPVRVKIPDDLLQALRERRCVPVLGPGLLALGAVRSEPPPPGPRDLARKLADRSSSSNAPATGWKARCCSGSASTSRLP
jgi:hypothetical protein